MEKCDIKDNFFLFSENYSIAVTKNYLALEKEEILNITVFALFSFL